MSPLGRSRKRRHDRAGVEVVGGDLTDPASLAPALRGVSGLHLITFGGALFAPLETGEAILALAKEAGVRRVTVPHGGGDTPVESAGRASDFAWTVVMPVEFMANALEWAPGIRSEGVVREPYVDRLSAMVHEADIGAVAAVALTEDGHGGREYLVTGPEALTVRDRTAAIGAARGADVELVELTEEQALENWRGQGMPEGRDRVPDRRLPGHPAGGPDRLRHGREGHRQVGADLRAVGRGARAALRPGGLTGSPGVGPRSFPGAVRRRRVVLETDAPESAAMLTTRRPPPPTVEP